jgi:uncharacterized damage-inducible protein DinB
MEPYFNDYLDRLSLMHAELNAALQGLPQAALDWTPAPGANSLAVLVVHTAGAERYLIGDCVLGEPSGRDREAEFRLRDLPAEALEQRLDDSLAYIQQVLAGLTLQDLTALRPWPRQHRQVTVGWLLSHLLAHTAIHAGHAQVTRQWWEQTFPAQASP